MVPSAISQLGTLPLTPNGKLDRNALVLPEGNGSPRNRNRAPGDETEARLVEIWEDVLRRRPIGLDDDFFALGGHSLLAARLTARVGKTLGIKLPLASVFEAPTVAQMASLLRDRKALVPAPRIIALRASGFRPPLFLVGPLFGTLLPRMSGHQPVYGVSSVAAATLAPPFRLEDVAARQVATLREFRPVGPYLLAGWCAYGVLAYEMARQLREQGQDVGLVVMFDSFNAAARRGGSRWTAWRERMQFHIANLSSLGPREAAAYCRQRAGLGDRLKRRRWRAQYRACLLQGSGTDQRMDDFEQIVRLAAAEYVPARSDLRVLLFRAGKRPGGAYADAALGWKELVRELEVVDVPGSHESMFVEPNVEVTAAALETALRRIDAP